MPLAGHEVPERILTISGSALQSCVSNDSCHSQLAVVYSEIASAF